MKVTILIVFNIWLYFIPAVLPAEDLIATSENTFESEEITAILTPDMFAGTSEFVFRSSPALRGNIEFSSIQGENIEIIYHKILYAGSREEAETFSDIISLRTEKSGNSFYLVADAPRNAPWRKSANLSGQIECEVYIPDRFSVSMDVVGYYLNIKGSFPEVDVKGNYCEEIRVSRVELGLKINAKNSLITLRDINGPTLIISEGGNIRARNIKSGLGIASFECHRGAITVESFSGDELHCEAVEGKINLEKITLVGGANAYVSNSGINSDIYMDIEEIEDARLEIINRSADVMLILPRDVASSFNVSTDPDNGEIEVDGLPLITEVVEYGRLQGHTVSYNSRIMVDARGTGKITLRRKEF